MQVENRNKESSSPSVYPSSSVRNEFVYGIIGVLVLGGAIYFGRRFILKKMANKEENSSLEEGSAPTYAKQLKMSFENDGWPGTDTTGLRNTLRQIKSKEEFKQVMTSYNKLYNSNLLKDMSNTKNTFVYCDPPYIGSNMGHYKGYTEEQYKQLLARLSKLKGKFLLSAYPSKILSVFIKKYKWKTQSIQTRVSVTKHTDKSKTEMLIMNYDPKAIRKSKPERHLNTVSIGKLSSQLKKLKFAA